MRRVAGIAGLVLRGARRLDELGFVPVTVSAGGLLSSGLMGRMTGRATAAMRGCSPAGRDELLRVAGAAGFYVRGVLMRLVTGRAALVPMRARFLVTARAERRLGPPRVRLVTSATIGMFFGVPTRKDADRILMTTLAAVLLRHEVVRLVTVRTAPVRSSERRPFSKGFIVATTTAGGQQVPISVDLVTARAIEPSWLFRLVMLFVDLVVTAGAVLVVAPLLWILGVRVVTQAARLQAAVDLAPRNDLPRHRRREARLSGAARGRSVAATAVGGEHFAAHVRWREKLMTRETRHGLPPRHLLRGVVEQVRPGVTLRATLRFGHDPMP